MQKRIAEGLSDFAYIAPETEVSSSIGLCVIIHFSTVALSLYYM